MADEHRLGREVADYAAALRKVFDPEAAIERLLAELMALVPNADGVIVGLAEADGRVRFVRTGGALHGLAGASIDRDTSLSGLAMQDRKVLVCNDASSDGRVDRVVLEQIEMKSLVAVPLVRGGVAFGVVDMVARASDAFGEADLAVCTTLADVIAGVVSFSADATRLFDALDTGRRQVIDHHADDGDAARMAHFVTKVLSPVVISQVDTRQRIAEIISDGRVEVVLQPIIRLDSMEPVAFEALSRFQGPPTQPPDWWFAQAHTVGLGVELELLALHKALEILPVLPAEAALAVNLGPEALCTADALALIGKSDPARLVVELTEHAPVDDYPTLCAAISAFRRIGARLAVDDTGAGFSSLSHIARLRPDLIKLDRWIVTDIDTDAIKQALVQGLLTVAEHLHAEVIAEGVENAQELDMLNRLGVHLGQGYHLGIPAPPSTSPVPAVPAVR